jgi:hypothetical protein
MDTHILNITPVLPSLDIKRDVAWYEEKTGFRCLHHDDGYAVLKREHFYLHLQWHADTVDDPLLGGSVVKIFVKDIRPILDEMVESGTVKPEKLRLNTSWQTNEFGFYDLNNNAIFFVEDI